MCRFVYRAGGLNFFSPLRCSTDADELYYAAKCYCDLRKVALVAIEPCGIAFGKAVARPSSGSSSRDVVTE